MQTMQPELQSENHYGYRPERVGNKIALYFGISFAAHLTIVLLLLFMPDGKESQAAFNRFESIDIQLVSLDPRLPRVSSGGDAPADGPGDEGVPVADPADSGPIPVKSAVSRNSEAAESTLTLPDELQESKPALKKSPAKTPPRPGEKRLVTPEALERKEHGRRVADAVKRLETETAEGRGKAAVRRRIEEMAGKTDGDERSPGGGGAVSDSAARRRGGREGGISPENFTRRQLYQAEVRQTLKRNWTFSEAMAGNTKGLESRVVITIMSDGKVADVWFEKRSGNDYLDDSVYKTVMKSDPLPSLPEGMNQYSLMVGFTPSGLK